MVQPRSTRPPGASAMGVAGEPVLGSASESDSETETEGHRSERTILVGRDRHCREPAVDRSVRRRKTRVLGRARP